MLLACPQCQAIGPQGLDDCGRRHIICMNCNASFALQKKPWREAEPEIKVEAEDKSLNIYAS